MNFKIEDFSILKKYSDKQKAFLEDFKVTKASKINDENYILHANNKHILPYNIYNDLTNFFSENLPFNVKLVIEAKEEKITLKDFTLFLNEYAKLNDEFKSTSARFENDEFIISYTNEEYYQQDLNKLDELKLFFFDLGYRGNITLELVNEEKYEPLYTDVVFEKPQYTEVKTNSELTKDKKFTKKSKDYKQLDLSELVRPLYNIQVEGEIFNFDEKDFTPTSRGRVVKFYLKNKENAICVKYFENERLNRELTDSLKNGVCIKIGGNYQEDNFSKNDVFVFMVNSLEKIDKQETALIDEAEVKRVELHCHSNRSEMDGVCDAGNIVKAAFKMGHKAIALTDHLVTQGFKHAFDACKQIRKQGHDFKVLYGCEFNVVDDEFKIVYNIQEGLLQDQEYVVFDLETTGLSIENEEIIEFGAVLLSKGNVLEKKSFFIKPHKKLSTKIKELTNIQETDLQYAKEFKEHVSEIKEFLKNRVLVAHNASFDYHFLNQELSRINQEPLTNMVVDTLDLSRALFPEKKYYRLGTMCKHYNVEYNEDDAHRAYYDAEVLASIFNLMIKDLNRQGVNNFNELSVFRNEIAYTKKREYHVTTLAQSKKGLKNIYKLVSKSHIERLTDGKPRITKNDLLNHKEDVLIGSSCLNGEVFEKATTASFKELLKTVSFFDYIEIQPLDNYRNLVVDREEYSFEELKGYLKNIIKAAQLENKLLVATGDMHYISDEEKIYRDVYINSIGIGNSFHPLYVRNEAKRLKQITPNQRLFTTKEMLEFYSWLNDEQLVYQMVLENTNKIADLCEYIEPFNNQLYPPRIKGENNEYLNTDILLKDLVYQTAHKQYGDVLDTRIVERIEKELNSIISNGFSGIYYVCHKLIAKSESEGYTVGSRGSVGSSLVATFSGITECNPLPVHRLCPNCKKIIWLDDAKCGYDHSDIACPDCGNTMQNIGSNIPFETFLGFEGDKIPDIDLNFSGEYQEKAHLFLKEIFDEDKVARAGTIGTVASKTAFGYVSGYMERMNLTNLDINNAQHERLASGCEGVKRTTGQHAGGIVVVPDDMDFEDFTPLQYPANNKNSTWITTHYDYHDYNDNLLKFDILGHVNPTSMKLLQEISGIDIKSIPFNDADVISLFNSSKNLKLINKRYDEVSVKLLRKSQNETNPILLNCKDATGALGIPEFGTATSRKTLFETRPNLFSDLVQLSGLSHGEGVWKGNAQDLVRNGMSISDVIGCRDDIMIYLINHGFDSKNAFEITEKVRKGKGVSENHEKLMIEKGVPTWYIESCKKIKYMFPKAHATAYCIDSVRIAWFKYHYPLYYYIQFFSLRCDDFEYETMIKEVDQVEKRLFELKELIDTRKASKKDENIFNTLESTYEMLSRGYRFSSIDINKSKANIFIIDPDDDKALIPPFKIIPSLGEAVANSIVQARDEKPFISVEDLSKRTQLSKTHLEYFRKNNIIKQLQQTNTMSLF